MQFFWEWLLFIFSPPLGAPHRVSSEAQSRAPPTSLLIRVSPELLVLAHKSIRKIFS